MVMKVTSEMIWDEDMKCLRRKADNEDLEKLGYVYTVFFFKRGALRKKRGFCKLAPVPNFLRRPGQNIIKR